MLAVIMHGCSGAHIVLNVPLQLKISLDVVESQ